MHGPGQSWAQQAVAPVVLLRGYKIVRFAVPATTTLVCLWITRTIRLTRPGRRCFDVSGCLAQVPPLPRPESKKTPLRKRIAELLDYQAENAYLPLEDFAVYEEGDHFYPLDEIPIGAQAMCCFADTWVPQNLADLVMRQECNQR